jgi:hypothetical protein
MPTSFILCFVSAMLSLTSLCSAVPTSTARSGIPGPGLDVFRISQSSLATGLPSTAAAPATPESGASKLETKLEEEEKKARQNLRRLIVLVIVIGLGGIFLLWLLFVCWRRLNRRSAGKPKARKKNMPDLWQAGGDRLSSQIEQEMRAEEGINSLDDIPDEDEDRDGEYDPEADNEDLDEDEDESEDDDETF